jgi:hypothetical protein
MDAKADTVMSQATKAAKRKSISCERDDHENKKQ